MNKHANHSVVNEIGRYTVRCHRQKNIVFADFITTSFAHVDRLSLRLVKLSLLFFLGLLKSLIRLVKHIQKINCPAAVVGNDGAVIDLE
jgi:hypothetical protein